MATMNISLPDRMKVWVEAQATTGRYSNASDYVRDLIRRAQEMERGRFSSDVTAAIDRALAAREDASAFVSHDDAMTLLDGAVEAAARDKSA